MKHAVRNQSTQRTIKHLDPKTVQESAKAVRWTKKKLVYAWSVSVKV